MYIVDFSAGTGVLLYVFVAAGIEGGVSWFAKEQKIEAKSTRGESIHFEFMAVSTLLLSLNISTSNK